MHWERGFGMVININKIYTKSKKRINEIFTRVYTKCLRANRGRKQYTKHIQVSKKRINKTCTSVNIMHTYIL